MRCTRCCRTSTYGSISGTSVARDFVEFAQPALRALAGSARGASETRAARANGGADPAGHARPASGRADLRHWVPDGGIRGQRRWSIWTFTRAPRPRTRLRRRPGRWRSLACRARSGCAMPRRISPMSSRATAIPAATTATCGPRSWTPTPSPLSRRRGMLSIRRSRTSWSGTSCRRADRGTRRSLYTAFRGSHAGGGGASQGSGSGSGGIASGTRLIRAIMSARRIASPAGVAG